MIPYLRSAELTVPLRDTAGHSPLVSVFGDLVQAARHADIMCKFAHGLSSFEVLSTLTGSGSYATTDGALTLSTGAASNSSCEIKSRETVRYLPGYQMYAMFTAAFLSTGQIGATNWIGFFNGNDGFKISQVNGVMRVQHWRGGSLVSGKDLARGNWHDNLDGTGASELNIDFTKTNLFMITIGHLGIAPVIFWISNGQYWLPFHVFEYANLQTALHLINPYLKVIAKVENTTNNTNQQLLTGCWNAGSIHDISTDQMTNNDRRFTVEVPIGAVTSTEKPFLSIFNKTNYPTASLENFVRILPALFNGVVEGTGTNPIDIRIYRNATLTTGTTTYTDYDNVNSCVQINTGATAFTGGSKIWFGAIGRNTGFNFDLLLDKLILYPNQSLTLTMQSASNCTADFMFRWNEEH